MEKGNFIFLSDLLRKKSGISLTEEKSYLLETRLKPLLRKHKIDDMAGLVAKIRINPRDPIVGELIDSMTTNESLFFRDTKPFSQLETIILPEFVNKPMRIWSAAASSGQEAYSTALTLESKLYKNYTILGTDISPTVIKKAQEGRYTQFEVQRGLPIMMLMQNFKQDGESWVVNDALKQKIQFKPYNLMDSYLTLGRFDIIMCRNVLIYFDREVKTAILDKMRQIINPEGYLFLGSSETMLNTSDKFVPVPGHAGLFKPV